MEHYAIQLLKKLIEIPTVNPPGKSYKEMAEFLRRELEDRV